jgi:hypothetical protein
MGDAVISMIHLSDPDFRICLVDFNTLLEIQSDAEKLGYATVTDSYNNVSELTGQSDAGADAATPTME